MRHENYDEQGLESVVEILRLSGVPTFRRYVRPNFTTPVEERAASASETQGLVGEELAQSIETLWKNYVAYVSNLPSTDPSRAAQLGLIAVLKTRLALPG